MGEILGVGVTHYPPLVHHDDSMAAIEDSGQQEVLNWCCLVGAMAELGRRPDESTLIETWIFNSTKCFAFFRP